MATRREKQGLRPVQDVVGRLRYDVGFDASRFAVGYEDRFGGVRETPLLDFIGAAEIPWHRIFSIKAGELVVWDRRARIDLVFGSGDSAGPDHAAIARACAPEVARPAPEKKKQRTGGPAEFVARACRRFDAVRGAWVVAGDGAPAGAPVEMLQVATYNVLFDLYETEKIYSERRVQECLALLRAREADVIALQEVTPTLWAALLAEPWVREGYYVSSGPEGEELLPYGQALLSRWPLALEEHAFSTQKRLLVGTARVGGKPVLFASVHLTSNYKGDADDRRAEQLAVLFERLGRPDVGDAIVCGDFNFGDDEENKQLTALVDAWAAAQPHHPGFTFDPIKNPLASIMSRTGRAARFDRILLRSPGGRIAPIDAVMFGDRPFGTGPDGQEQFASDHFGVCALLQVGEPARKATIEAGPVHTSALVVIPPEHLWSPIQAIRREHDPSFERWMPHINLVYGFVPEEHFEAAAEAIAAALRGRTPPTIRLEGLKRFDHRASSTVWLAPHSGGALEALQRELAVIFPNCDEQGERSGGGFNPHLTVAKIGGSEGEIAGKMTQWQAGLRPLEFVADAVYLISRREAEPFKIRRRVAIGGQPVALAPLPAWAELPSPRHVAAATAIAEACAEAIGATVHVVGSARLGVATPESDLDLVCAAATTEERAALYERVHRAIGRRGQLRARLASSAGMPVLRGTFDGLAFDLHAIVVPPELAGRDLAETGAEALARLDEPIRRAVLACVDADALVRLSGVGPAAFRGLLARVRRWARARQVDSGAWGLLGGFSWAILAAWAARDAGEKGMSQEPGVLLRHFFATFAGWAHGKAVAFGTPPQAPPGRRTQWPIWTPTAPAFNSARNLTSATLTLLQGELRRGHAVLSGMSDEAEVTAALCEPVEAGRRGIAVELRGDDDELQECVGRIDGHAVGLLIALEDTGARVRPFPRAVRVEGGLRWFVGCEGGEPARLLAAGREVLAQIAGGGEWPDGARLEASWREG